MTGGEPHAWERTLWEPRLQRSTRDPNSPTTDWGTCSCCCTRALYTGEGPAAMSSDVASLALDPCVGRDGAENMSERFTVSKSGSWALNVPPLHHLTPDQCLLSVWTSLDLSTSRSVPPWVCPSMDLPLPGSALSWVCPSPGSTNHGSAGTENRPSQAGLRVPWIFAPWICQSFVSSYFTKCCAFFFSWSSLNCDSKSGTLQPW